MILTEPLGKALRFFPEKQAMVCGTTGSPSTSWRPHQPPLPRALAPQGGRRHQGRYPPPQLPQFHRDILRRCPDRRGLRSIDSSLPRRILFILKDSESRCSSPTPTSRRLSTPSGGRWTRSGRSSGRGMRLPEGRRGTWATRRPFPGWIACP